MTSADSGPTRGSEESDRRFEKHRRLLERPDFVRANRGRRRQTSNLVMRYVPGTGSHARFGLAVSRKVGNAVVRNQVKRWLREAIRHERHGVGCYDVVFIARPSSSSAGYQRIRDQVAELLGRLKRTG